MTEPVVIVPMPSYVEAEIGASAAASHRPTVHRYSFICDACDMARSIATILGRAPEASVLYVHSRVSEIERCREAGEAIGPTPRWRRGGAVRMQHIGGSLAGTHGFTHLFVASDSTSRMMRSRDREAFFCDLLPRLAPSASVFLFGTIATADLPRQSPDRSTVDR